MQQPRSKTRNGPGTTNTGPTGTTNEKPKIGLVKSEPGVSPPNASPPKTNLPLADSGHQSYGSVFWISIPFGSKKGQLMSQKQSEFMHACMQKSVLSADAAGREHPFWHERGPYYGDPDCAPTTAGRPGDSAHSPRGMRKIWSRCGDGMGAARTQDTARPRPQARGCDLARGVAMRFQKGGVIPGLGRVRYRLPGPRPQKSNNPTADDSGHGAGCGRARPPETMRSGDS